MSPAIALTGEEKKNGKDDKAERQYQKGVKHLYESGISRVPDKYILPILDRPATATNRHVEPKISKNHNLTLPIIDFADLQGSNRDQVLKSLSNACEQFGFFQVGLDEISEIFKQLNYISSCEVKKQKHPKLL